MGLGIVLSVSRWSSHLSMGGSMETRLDTFNGWQMMATVESRPAMTGNSRYYIVLPLAYKEFSMSEAMHPATSSHISAPFDNLDDAFQAAFGVCRRAVMNAIKLRNLQSFS